TTTPQPGTRRRIAGTALAGTGARTQAGDRRMEDGALPRRAFARLAHRERPPTERLAIERVDGGLGLRVGGELDEGEPSRTPGLAVGHDLDLLDLSAALLEEGSKLRLTGLIRNVPDVQSLRHLADSR